MMDEPFQQFQSNMMELFQQFQSHMMELFQQFQSHMMELFQEYHSYMMEMPHYKTWPGILESFAVDAMEDPALLFTVLWKSCTRLLLFAAIATIIPGKLHVWSARVLRVPVFIITISVLLVELALYTLVRLTIHIAEAVFFFFDKHRALRKELNQAKSYKEWHSIASKIDSATGRDQWKYTITDNTAGEYNWAFLNRVIEDMRFARENDDMILAMIQLHQAVKDNVAGIMNEELYSVTNTGETKAIIKEFLEETVITLHWLTEKVRLENLQNFNSSVNSTGSVDLEEFETSSTASYATSCSSFPTSSRPSPKQLEKRELVKTFLKRAKAAYGRTALCLSGGGMIGCYHFGHIHALMELDVLPQIISGSSAGAIAASFVCTRTDEELERDFNPVVIERNSRIFQKSPFGIFMSILRTGYAYNYDEFIDVLEWYTTGTLTFEEAYKKTGRILCITLSPTTKESPPVVVNYITAPNVTIASGMYREKRLEISIM